MNITAIRKYRLINQQIVGTKFNTAKEIVGWLGAVQAQDYAMAKWAIGVRLPGSTDDDIEYAIDQASIIRTHILRPTWHFVSADDIRWMLELTAPRINAAAASMYRKLELDKVIFNRSNAVIEKSLEGGKHLTRQELMTELKKDGINTNDLRANHLMFRAELEGIVCNGSMRGKQFTYALLDERVPKTRTWSREEALAELAKRYFTSHGPATLQDFSWWSGLSKTDAGTGLNLIKSGLISDSMEAQTYWFPHALSLSKNTFECIHFLPAFDEFMISYKDRSASLSSVFAKDAISGNGIFKPIIVVNGEVVGIWKRTIKKDSIKVAITTFDPVSEVQKQEVLSCLAPYGKYMNKEVIT